MKRFFLFFTLLALLSSCGKDENEGGGGNTGGGNNPNTPSTQTSITISPSALTFDAQGEKKSVTVTCTAGKTWALSGGESWCTASATSGSNGATVTFTAEANPSPDERNATYTFTCGDKTAKLQITQQGGVETTIHVPTKGTLASVLAENDLEASSIVLLKITGEINDVDIIGVQDMSNLVRLDISGTNLTELPAGTFQRLKNLKKVILPNTLTSIGAEAFEKSGLQSIEIPASVETIEEAAFQGCTALTTVTFEKGSQLKTIGGMSGPKGAFSECTALTAIEIPASVETIEEAAFFGCTALMTVTFEKGSQLKTIGGDYLAKIYYGAFSDCTALTAIEIPASVETIERAAFQGCTALTTVTFEKGSQLKTMGRNSFDCSSLRLFKIGMVTPPDAKDAFSSLPSFAILKVPAESVEAYKKARGWSEFSNISALD